MTPPKKGNRILFVCDPSLMITQIHNVQLLYNNRTSFEGAPRLLDGSLTEEDRLRMPSDKPSLVAYCKTLGLPDTSML